MKLQPLPRSKAKTAYGLVSDVARAILAEPRRADLHSFIGIRHPQDGGPVCGTVGCFAGWVSLLAGYKNPNTAEAHAHTLLGEQDDINYYTGPGKRRFGFGDYVFSAGDIDIKDEPGTERYARSVVRRIRKFQRINAVALKARKLTTNDAGKLVAVSA